MIRNFMSAEATVINIEIIAYYWGYYKNAMFQDFQHFWQHLACRPNFSTKRVFSMSLQTNSQSLQAATDITNFTRKDGKYQKHFTKTLQTFQTALHVSVVPFPSHFHSGLHKDKQIPFFSSIHIYCPYLPFLLMFLKAQTCILSKSSKGWLLRVKLVEALHLMPPKSSKLANFKLNILKADQCWNFQSD